MNIYVYVIDSHRPLGGVKQLYRHVDILNRNGFSAWAVHQKKGYRCTWFENDTRVTDIFTAMYQAQNGKMDYLVIPENLGPDILDMTRGIKKVVFNQNCYYSFGEYPIESEKLPPYLDGDVLATLVVSDDSMEYMKYAFPGHRFYRIHNGINHGRFQFQSAKKRQIAFAIRKNADHVLQVINILKFRGALDNYELVVINDRTEDEVAAILQQSVMYLSFGYPEGCPLSAAEAMLCGCLVVGYHGMGGREYFNPEYCYPVPVGDITAFARTVEVALGLCETHPGIVAAKAERAAAFIRETYSMEREEQELMDIWKDIVQL